MRVDERTGEGAAAITLMVVVALPVLIGFNLPPSATFFNQAAAWAAWGAFAAYALRYVRRTLVQAAVLAACQWVPMLIVAVAAVGSWALGSLPFGLTWASVGTIFATILVALLGTAVVASAPVVTLWCGALVVAAVASALVGVVQVFHPSWADGTLIAHSATIGRAVGNLRQPNHLASLLLMGAIAVIPLLESDALGRSAARRWGAYLMLALLVYVLMLSGSRTGAAGLFLLLLWAVVDRQLSRASRVALAMTPLIYAISWWLVQQWSAANAGPAIGAAQRVGQGDVTTGRGTIWSNTLQLIGGEPWLGVGFGEFNRAWTLTSFTSRWPEFFDHTHNLPLQFLVELGIPLGVGVVSALAWALWQAWTRARTVEGSQGAALRAMFVMVLLMGLHSLLEYPLWYAHFLFPTAFAWGLCLGAGASPAPPGSQIRWPIAAGAALVLGAGAMVWDYQQVSAIFAPPDDGSTLEQRIAEGQRSWFFAHHADYARITTFEDVSPPSLDDFRRATHFLLDTRLQIAWANAHARAGDVERARWIADRLRELKQSSAAPYFAPCTDPAVVDKPYQCTSASRTFSWRDFK
jgi:hypothetical protein